MHGADLLSGWVGIEEKWKRTGDEEEQWRCGQSRCWRMCIARAALGKAWAWEREVLHIVLIKKKRLHQRQSSYASGIEKSLQTTDVNQRMSCIHVIRSLPSSQPLRSMCIALIK